MPLRQCLVCGVLSDKGRCRVHRAEQQRALTKAKRRLRPERDWSERQRRKAAVDTHRAQYGDWCPGYEVAAHGAADLTADHDIPYAISRSESGPLVVLCRSCNGRKADSVRVF